MYLVSRRHFLDNERHIKAYYDYSGRGRGVRGGSCKYFICESVDFCVM